MAYEEKKQALARLIYDELEHVIFSAKTILDRVTIDGEIDLLELAEKIIEWESTHGNR